MGMKWINENAARRYGHLLEQIQRQAERRADSLQKHLPPPVLPK